jgi:hypothetical protein
MQTKQQLEDNFLKLIDSYKSYNPKLKLNFLAKLLNSFITYLRNHLENLDDKKTGWNNIIVKIEYSLGKDDDGSENIYMKESNPAQNIMEKVYLDIFRTITKNAKIFKTNGNSNYQTPKEFLKEISNLSDEEQGEKVYKLFNPEPFIIKPFDDRPTIIINFQPLVHDKDSNQKYYQVLLKLDVGTSKPYNWKEEAKNFFWNGITEYVYQITGDNTFSFVHEIEPALLQPEKLGIKTLDKSKQLIKASLHTELQKFGRKPKKNGTIFDLLPEPLDDEVQKDISDYKIEVIGLDNTKAQNQALFAVQKLFHETGYQGNSQGKTLSKNDNSFKFMGYLPAMKFTPAQYLEAYGVNKKESSRGKWEYHSNERSEAMKALRELSQKKYLFYYERKYWKDGKEVYDLITTVRSLFNITEGYEAIDKNVVTNIKTGKGALETDQKIGNIVLEPCPMLLDQIDTYFVLKPANYYQEIKLLVGKTGKQVPLFIDFLIAEVTKKEISAKGKEIDWLIEMNYETLAYKLRMDKLLKQGKATKIKQELHKCYEIAKQLGYLMDYKTVLGATMELERLTLNSDKFKRVKEINEEIIKIDSKVIF